MRRVLVTGATGFIGHHLPGFLRERGYEVHAVARSGRPAQDGVTWHAADLLASAAVAEVVAAARPTHLLHLAWHAAPSERWTSVENVRWLEASLALLRAFAAAGGQRAVMAGSCAEYDWRYGFCSEEVTPLASGTLYGRTKRALGDVAQAAAEAAGVRLAWARIFFAYGPREEPGRLVASVARALLGGEEAATTEGTQRRDFLHAADIADALVALLDASLAGPVNIGSGQAVAVRDVVETVARLVGRSDLLRIGAAAPRGPEAPLVLADVRRLHDEVGWHPRRDLEEGLAETVEWWRRKETAR